MAQHITPLSTWKLPEGFQRVDSQVPGVEVFAPVVETAMEDQPTSFTCPHCGANVAYDVSAGGIACEYCGYIAPVRAEQVGRSADEFEFTLETLSHAAHGWGTERQMLSCESCGARISIPAGVLSSSCPFCASNQVNLTAGMDENLRPRFLIPFKITRERTRGLTENWLGKGWFHPNQLAASTVTKKLTGVYLPYWTFDTRVHAQWRAQVGYEHTERHYNAREKRWETRTKIVWRWESGRVELGIDDFLVSGSMGTPINQSILSKIRPFDFSDLVAYEPDYLVGWQAQAYETPLTDAWEICKKAVREQAKEACYQDIPTHHVRNFSMSADFEEETWRYILLPIYLAAYKYENDIFQMMINGQTGAVAGHKPVAWCKVWLAIAGMLSPGLLLGMIGLPLMLLDGAGIVPIMIGIFLFILGVVLSVIVYNKARQSEGKS